MTMTKTAKTINDLIPDKHNANKGTVRGLAALEDSISEYGAGRSILVDRDGNVIAGNKTLQSAADAGLEVIVVPTDGTKLVVVQRTDLGLYDDDKRARLLAYADNRISELDLEWDAEQLLADLNAGVPLTVLFEDDELLEILNELKKDGDESGSDSAGDPLATMTQAEAWRLKWRVERGKCWQVGRHRVMCGDSYNTEHVNVLLDGAVVDMLHTDPPYGINIVDPRNGQRAADSGGAKAFGKTSATKNLVPGESRHEEGSRSTGTVRSASRTALIIQPNEYPVIEGDDRPFDPVPFLSLAPVVILWGANYYADKLPISSGWICWDKREGITRNNFADGELAWTNQRKPMRIFRHLWNGLHKGSQHGQKRLHPTEKPIALFAEIGKMYADKGLWLDLFAGSGSQVVAAEQTGATCYAMEWEPLYVATILERLSALGLTPELVKTIATETDSDAG